MFVYESGEWNSKRIGASLASGIQEVIGWDSLVFRCYVLGKNRFAIQHFVDEICC